LDDAALAGKRGIVVAPNMANGPVARLGTGNPQSGNQCFAGRNVSFHLLDRLLGRLLGVRVAALPGPVVKWSSACRPRAPHGELAKSLGMYPAASPGDDLDYERDFSRDLGVSVRNNVGSGHQMYLALCQAFMPFPTSGVSAPSTGV